MTIANLNSWADNLEIIWIPDVNTDIAILQDQQIETDALLSAKIQEFSDRLDAHGSSLTSMSSSLQSTLNSVTNAVTRASQAEAAAKTYADDLANTLRYEFLAFDSQIPALITDRIELVLAAKGLTSGSLLADIQEALAIINGIRDGIYAQLGEFDDASSFILSQIIPKLETLQTEVLQDLDNLKSEIGIFLTDFTHVDLKSAMDELEANARADADEAIAAAQAVAEDLQAQAGQIADEVAARGELAFESAKRYRSLVQTMESLRDYVADLDYQSYTSIDELRRQLNVAVESYAANFDERITTAASDNKAITERVVVLEAKNQDISAQIIEIDTARVEGEEALAQQISALSVGTNTQFDSAKIWFFDTALEDWTGAPEAPSVSNGFLRPASGSGSYILSPGALEIASTTYSQVRGRLRKVGSPVWLGHLWWRATGEEWDILRRVTVLEPAWLEGAGNFTHVPAWTGQIDQIRLDLVSAPDVANYIEIDWVAIGRPTPGASYADLVTERKARMDADAVQASIISTLTAGMSSNNDDLAIVFNAVEAIDGWIEEKNDLIVGHGEAITALELDMVGKASAAAVEQLTVDVAELENGVTTQSASTTSLRNTLNLTSMENLDAQFAAWLEGREILEAVAEADESLRTSLTSQGNDIAAVADKVTRLELTIPDLATASALQSLSTRVETTENTMVTEAQLLTALDTAIEDIGSSTVISGLTSRVGIVETVANSKNRVWRQNDGPTNLKTTDAGDLWFDTNDNNLCRRWNGTGWDVVQDANIPDLRLKYESVSSDVTWLNNKLGKGNAVDALSILETSIETVETVANSKNRVWRQPSAPTGLTANDKGDLWFDTDDKNLCLRWNGTIWENVGDGRIPDLATRISLQGEDLVRLEGQIEDKADASAVDALTVRVSSTEVVANSKNRVWRQSSQPMIATVGDIWFDTDDRNKCFRWNGTIWESVRDTEIPDLAGKYEVVAQRVTDLEVALPGKAEASAFNLLEARVGTVETVAGSKNRVWRRSDEPIGLTSNDEGDLWFDSDDKNKPYRWSGTAWVEIQDGNIPEIIDSVDAHADALTRLGVKTDRYSAAGKFRVSVESTPTGATARIGLSAAASDSDSVQSAALFLEATAGGSSRALVEANRFAVINGSQRAVPFVVEDGTVYMKSAWIKNASILGAQIGNLEVDTLQIANNAVTIPVNSYAAASVNVPSATTEKTVATLTISRAAGYATRLGFSALGAASSTTATAVNYTLYRGTTSLITFSSTHFAVNSDPNTLTPVSMVFWDNDTAGGSTTYSIKATRALAGVDANLSKRSFEAQQFKR